MKKEILIVFVLVFVAGVYAGASILPRTNDSITLKPEYKTALSSYDLRSLEVSDMVCDGTKCYFTLSNGNQRAVYDVPQKDVNGTEYNIQQLRTMRNEMIKLNLEAIAQNILDASEKQPRVGGGTITIR